MDNCAYVIRKVLLKDNERKREFYCVCNTLQDASEICNRLNIYYNDAKFFYEELNYWTLKNIETNLKR